MLLCTCRCNLLLLLKIPDLRYTVKLEWCPHYRGEIEVHLILGVLLYCNAYIGPRAYQRSRAKNKDFRLIGHLYASRFPSMVYCSFMPGQITNLTGQKANLFGICPMAACYFQLCQPTEGHAICYISPSLQEYAPLPAFGRSISP